MEAPELGGVGEQGEVAKAALEGVVGLAGFEESGEGQVGQAQLGEDAWAVLELGRPQTLEKLAGGVVDEADHTALVIDHDEAGACGYEVFDVGEVVFVQCRFAELDGKGVPEFVDGQGALCTRDEGEHLVGECP